MVSLRRSGGDARTAACLYLVSRERLAGDALAPLYPYTGSLVQTLPRRTQGLSSISMNVAVRPLRLITSCVVPAVPR
jgi:hypothetical protein